MSWGRVLATAVLDRLVQRAHILNIRDNSCRMKGSCRFPQAQTGHRWVNLNSTLTL
ncbi:ATP-binding protein [Anoxybacillus sp. P3H1B]|uniref:ATP-binding protein n=1 Tax=Anoxybacillus sp. P3H1B TaxID=1769293 RepID=UPI003515412A